MLLSLALIFLGAMLLKYIFEKIMLPGFIGVIIAGIVLGPYVLNLIDGKILAIAAELKKLALIVILVRAGLSLDIEDLKKVGRPAILLSFIPSAFELAAVMIFAPLFFGVPIIEAAIMGCVLAAVSPAVIIPRMIKLTAEGYGKDKSIPQLIMAAASVDNIFVIVLFTVFMGAYSGGSFSASSLAKVPVSIALGIALGALSGIMLAKFFKRFHMKDTVKVIILLCVSFLFVALEDGVKDYVPVSGLLAIMTAGIALLKTYPVLAHRLQSKFSKIWVAAELMLFVLVGASVDLSYASGVGLAVFAVLGIALLIRLLGVIFALIGTRLNSKEKLFCLISYIPKATVQAAIGAIPLAAGVPSGSLILTMAVLAIFVTAPLGALGIDLSYKNLLSPSAARSE